MDSKEKNSISVEILRMKQASAERALRILALAVKSGGVSRESNATAVSRSMRIL